MDKEYFDKKFAEIPKEVLIGCTKLILDEFPQDVKDEIKEMYEKDGENRWAIPYHNSWGMGVRNLFREEGFLDKQLPDGNWDDYYVQVIEFALGLRESSIVIDFYKSNPDFIKELL